MRRRAPDVAELTERGLSVDALRTKPVDDLSLPVAERVRVFDAWMVERAAWVSARRGHAELHGWQGGDHARQTEEDEAHPIGDAPFDPDSI